MRFVWRILGVAALTAAGLFAGATAEASASCVASPPASPWAFTGTVVSTEHDGRVAAVRTDDGRRVEVVGTSSVSGFTSVDRDFEIGARYEFHPANSTSPYEDNICTRTHLISSPPTEPTTETTLGIAHKRPAAGDTPSGLGTTAAIAGSGAAIALIAAFVVWRRRRAGSA
jgi:hypothetical protein